MHPVPVGSPRHSTIRRAAMEITEGTTGPFVIGGVDIHKDLHVAAVVDDHDRLLGSQSFATTRHGYKQMLAWMRSFGPVRRVGVEVTGTYGAGLLRYLQKAGVEVLEVRPRTRGIGESAARTTTSMHRTPPMRHSPANVPSRPKAATA